MFINTNICLYKSTGCLYLFSKSNEEYRMSNQNPGNYFDACNSWNGYNHQGKIALYVAIKSIVDNWDETISAEENLKNLENNFLEIEYIEDFALGKIEGGEPKYISIHQVKDRQDTPISSYDSALLGLGQHFIDCPDIEGAYLHTTIQLSVSDEHLTEYVKSLCKAPKYLTDLKKHIEGNRTSGEFRNNLIEKKRGRPDELKRRLKEAFHKDGANAAVNITKENLDEALDKLIESIDKEIADISGISDENIKKISIYNYPIKSGQAFCGVDSAKKLINDILKKYYEKAAPDSYKITDEKFLEKAYLFILGKLDQHIVERDLNYLAYKDNSKDRKIYFNTIISWLNSDEIDSHGKDFYLNEVKEILYSKKIEYCTDCDKKPCAETCKVNDFIDVLGTLKFNDLNQFLHYTNPNVVQEISTRTFDKYASDGFYEPFLKGLRDIGVNFSFKDFAVSYMNDKAQSVLTTLRKDGKDKINQRICADILKNEDVFSLLMEADSLISKDIEVDSIQEKLLSPISGYNDDEDDDENEKEKKHNITKIKDVKIEKLKTYIQNLQQGEEE